MDNIEAIEKEAKRLSHLTQFSKTPKEELLILAKESLEKKEILSGLTCCLPEEIPFATKLLENYLKESSLSSYAEKDTLKQLIYLEVIVERIKTYINKETEKANPVPPIQMLEQLQYLNKQLIEIKKELGLSQREEQKTVLEEWTKLKAKALAYYKENAGCNVVKCPECKKLFMLLKDVRNYTPEKITFFKKTMLYNKKLFELYGLSRITKEEMAIILGVSNEYIELIYNQTYLNDKNDK